jgi:glutamate dehydrogenase
MATIYARVFGIVIGPSKDRQRLVTAENVRLGVPDKLARKMAALLLTRGGLDISDLARIHNKDVVKTARMYSQLSDRLGLVWLHRSVESLAVEGRWQALARSNLRDEFYRIRRDLSASLLRAHGKSGPEELFEEWAARNAAGVRKLDSILEEMKLRQEIDFATLSVAAQELRKLISS